MLFIYLSLICYRSFGEGNEETENISPNINSNIDLCNNNLCINEEVSNPTQTHQLIDNEPSTSQEITGSDITSHSSNVVSKKNMYFKLIFLCIF